MLYQIENWHDLRDLFWKELDESVCRMKFGVDDINVPGTVMIPVPDFEKLSDEDLFSRLRALREPVGELFFDTDAIIISFPMRLVWMFHHSGYIGLFCYGERRNGM